MEYASLDCPVCEKELISPILLSCLHTVCLRCFSDRSDCPACLARVDSIPCPDQLATFLIDTIHEEAELCANCEKNNHPMYFCETCKQSLCSECRTTTHQAKMFTAHKIVRAEERARVHCRVTCEQHDEPYLLYSLEQRKLVCIKCFNDRPLEERHDFVSVDSGHQSCIETIEKWAMKLQFYQDEKREELEVRQRILAENNNNYQAAKSSLFQLCQQILDTVLSTRDRLMSGIGAERGQSEKMCLEQIEQISAIMGPIRLCLLSAQIMRSTASKLDVLQLSGELFKRIQTILTRSIDKLPATRVVDPTEARLAIAKSLEPYLGLFAAWCPFSMVRDESQEGSGSMKSYKTRSGSHSLSMPPMLSKFQALVDLSGAFGSLFAKVEGPLKNISIEIADLSKKVQEVQRDLTMRRCLIKADAINSLIKHSTSVETRLGMSSAVLNDMQPEMQQIWQEQLDRVRRQQIIYREKVEECLSLRETARHVLTAAKQLAPYAACIENMSALIDPKRCLSPNPAPMESICMQISEIQPDSHSRILAIEKEEKNRKAVQDAKKKEEQAGRETGIKTLKPGKKKKENSRILVNTNRERSPGGTDSTLLSPCLIRRLSPTVREEAVSDVEIEGMVWHESFDLSWEMEEEKADLIIREEAFCFSSLSVTSAINGDSTLPQVSLPPLEVLLARIPLANRVTVDVDTSRQSMLQSLHDVFASQKSESETPVCEEPNVLASVVKIAQKTKREHMVEGEKQICRIQAETLMGTVEDIGRQRRSIKKTKLRKAQEDICPQQLVILNEVTVVPDVPYVPSRVFQVEDKSNSKLGSFEAKEKVLQSLKEKVRLSEDSK